MSFLVASHGLQESAMRAGICGVFKQTSAASALRWEADQAGVADPVNPAWWHAGDLSIGLHGEIHNLEELARHLGLPPGSRGLSVLAAAWQKWSFDMLRRLDGVFALVVRSGNELLLYRDSSGLRHLYFECGPDNLVAFATHLAALPSTTAMQRSLASHAVDEYLRLLEIAPPNTLLTGVTAVEPGQSVHWTRARASPSVRMTGAPPRSAPDAFEAAVERLDSLLRASVRVRLPDALRPAAFLSGGVDSALICALAGAQRKDLTAVTVGFECEALDESPAATRIATHLGLVHEVWRFTRAQYLDAFVRLSRHADQPVSDPAAMATLLALEQCRQRFDVVLDGTGADEAVGLMPARHVRLAVGYAGCLPSRLRLPLARLLGSTPILSGYAPILDFEHPADTMSRWHGFRRREIQRLTGRAVSLEQSRFIRTFHRFPRLAHFERYSAMLDAMTSERLNQAIAISGATVRFPFCEPKTDQFIRQLPTEFRYLPGEPKRILRALLARYVPAMIWKLPKHGFDFPLRDFLAGDKHELVRHHLDPARWRSLGLLREDEVQSYRERFIGGDDRVTFRVWALVVLGAWLQEHRQVVASTA